MRVVVTGSRVMSRGGLVLHRLREVQERWGEFTYLAQGGATGADNLAAVAARDMGVFETWTFKVDHQLDGPWPGAGCARNRRMLEAARPDLVVAFWDGKREASGTLDCIQQAINRGIPVEIFWYG